MFSEVSRGNLSEATKAYASELGFVRCGIAPAAPLAHQEFYRQWLAAGNASAMDFLHRTADQRGDPRNLLPEVKSAIVVAASYINRKQAPAEKDQGQIARYARGIDYHGVLRQRLGELQRWLRQQVGYDFAARAVVDTAPLLERELAVSAGLGFIGKNTMLITPGIGSFTVLGALLTSLPLTPDEPINARCGKCTLCLDACPTGALKRPYELDARRCVAYLTIEHRGEIADELQSKLGNWVFGCDICQLACPYNAPHRHAHNSDDRDLAPAAAHAGVDLDELLNLRSGAYRRLVRNKALSRTPRAGFIRNATIATRNARSHRATDFAPKKDKSR